MLWFDFIFAVGINVVSFVINGLLGLPILFLQDAVGL